MPIPEGFLAWQDEAPERPKKAAKKRSGPPGGSHRGNWWGTFAVFVDESMADLPPAASVVWLALFRNSTDWKVGRSGEQLAEDTGMTRSNVVKMLRLLKASGHVQVIGKGGRNAGPTRYRLHARGHVSDD